MDPLSLKIIRCHVAEDIKNRDEGIESDWQKIILCVCEVNENNN